MESIAIIGTGISGMSCGYFLNSYYNIDVFEQNNYIGGHTNTVYVDEADKQIPIDTGFIVFNFRTYPNLVRLFDQLNVEIRPTNMSFGVQHIPSGLVYSSQNLFAQKKNYVNPRFWKLLLQIQRFFKEAEQVLNDTKYQHYSLKDYIKENGYNDDFVHQYIVPMSSALWSTPVETTLHYPVSVLVSFFKNHGLLGINKQFQWYTVNRGSWQYRDKLIARFKDKIRTQDKVVSVCRVNGKAVVRTTSGFEKIYDKVILATHADQALALLEDATPHEWDLLKPFEYQKNVAKLHTDARIMPAIRSTWSAWNYRVQNINNQLTATTVYDMNILQRVSQKENYFVSINDPGLIDESKVIRTINYEHPIFTPHTANSQTRLSELNSNGVTYFCGSYFKFGFHEDALASAVNVCQSILKRGVWHSDRSIQEPVGVYTT